MNTPTHRTPELFHSWSEGRQGANERPAPGPFTLELSPPASFLEVPALHVAAQAMAMSAAGVTTSESAHLRSGQRISAHRMPAAIGRYRVLRLLGEGGMGAVYEAEQDQPRRTVALKVIKPGFATAEILHRFQHESQALGRLQHPGIAQIYEASMADTGFGPQPYYAMEFIRGQALLEYAETRKLSARDRLALIAKICDAVDHAHHRGVIHRDLKPANILVDETRQPKVLDFGVARVTEHEAHYTRETHIGQLLGTLAYMSPEQVSGDPGELDLRADVYALGVTTYELLVGKLPYHIGQKSLAEAIVIIREEEPAALSAIDRHYRGDIDTIVAKALEKDKARRYASTADLAADIRRYLADQPIAARPASVTYQLQKFTRRHKSLVATMAAVLLVLAWGGVANKWEALHARRAERAAVEQRDRAAAAERRATIERDRALAAERSAMEQSNRAVAAEARAQEERTAALSEKNRADAEAAAAQAVDDFLRNDILAQAGPDVQVRPDITFDPDLKLRTALDRAAARISGRFSTRPLVEAAIRQTIGEAYTQLGMFPQGEQHLQRALDLRRSVLGEQEPATLNTMKALAHNLYRYQHKYAEAEPLYMKILEQQRHALGDHHSDTLDTMDRLGDLYRYERKFSQAEQLLVMAVDGLRRLGGPDSPAALDAMNNLALVYQSQHKFAQAKSLFIAAMRGFGRVLGDENPKTLIAANNLGSLYLSQGEFQDAEPIFAKVLAARRRSLGEDHPDTRTSMIGLAYVYRAEKKFEMNEPLLRELVAVQERVLGAESSYALNAMLDLAQTYELEGKYANAEPLLTKILEIRRRISGPRHPATAFILGRLGELRLEESEYRDAERLIREALGCEKVKSDPPTPKYWESLLGASLAAQKKYAEAEPLLLEGYEGMMARKDRIPACERYRLDRAHEWVVQFYEATGQPQKAAAWRRNTVPQPPSVGALISGLSSSPF